MISSTQAAAIFAQQQQQFAGMQQYSQQISAQMPQPYQGLGAQGLGYQSTPGAFNYGMPNSMTSYGPGNSAGNAGLSFIGGAAPAVFAGASMLGGMGMLGSAGRALDPFSMGIGGWSAAGRMGMGLGGRLAMGAAGAAIPLAIGAGISHIAGSMVQGGQEQAGIEQVLSRFQFQNPNSRSGRGFTRQDSMQIGSMVRELAHIPDMLTSVSELTKVMDRIGGMGLMNGVRDAQQFQTKFKETLGTVKDVARILGTTLEEAAGAMGEARRSGFYSQTDVVKNAINRQVTSGLTGMNQQQVGALQQYGAQMGFNTGGSRASGAKNITRTAQQLGLMNQMGVLSNDQIMELTGEEGAAGIQSMAASLTEAGYKMSRSSLGTAMTLALGEVRDGRYTGKMDQALTDRMRRGELGKDELLRIAHQKAQGRNAKLSFAAHRSRLTSEMVGAVGAEGIGMELKGILGERGFDNPDAQNLVMQRYGVDERQAEQIMAMGKMAGTGELQARQGQEAKRAARNAYMAENFSWEAIKKKITTKIEGVTTEPFKKMGIGIRDTFANWMDEFIDDVTGHYSAQMSQGIQAVMRDVASGKSGASKTLAALTSGPGGKATFLGGSQNKSIIRDLAGGSDTERTADLARSLGFGDLVGNVSSGVGAATMANFARRISSQGVSALRAGNEQEYDAAQKQLKAIMTTEEVTGAKTDSDKLAAIMKKTSSEEDRRTTAAMGGEGASLADIPETEFEKLARKKGMTVERLVAGMLGGDADLKRMKGPDLAKIFSGEGDLPNTTEALAVERKKMERSLGGTKGLSAVQSALQNAGLVGGGALMNALTLGDDEQQEIMNSIVSGDIDKVKKYGITEDNAKDALVLLRGTKGAGKEGRAKLLRYAKLAAKETDSLMREHLEDRAVAARQLTKSSNKAIAAIGGSYADKLGKGDYEGAGGDIGQLVQALANIKDPKQRDKALSELSASGNYEIRGAYEEYRQQIKGGKKSGAALDAAVGKGADLLFGRAQSREGSVLASDEAVKNYFDKLNENQSQIAQILGNIAAGNKPGEGVTAGKPK